MLDVSEYPKMFHYFDFSGEHLTGVSIVCGSDGDGQIRLSRSVIQTLEKGTYKTGASQRKKTASNLRVNLS